MSELFKRNYSIFCFLCIVLSTSLLQAQNQQPIPEKVYLHTDRSIYFVGEDLWYKAYNVNAYNNLLYDNSNVLYVELVASDSKIVAKNKTNLEVGLGNGDFQLKDSLDIKPGHYQLRAYTNWNRKFGEDFVFKKNIEIVNAFDTDLKPNKHDKYSKYDKSQNTDAIVKTLTTGVQKTTAIDFFPEGGSLLENVACVVGFKIVDANGNPIEANGQVFDSNNEFIASFASSHDGMGRFQIIPLEGMNYYAKVKTATGTEFRMAIPKATKHGYFLSFKVVKGKKIITINTNPATLLQNPNEMLKVICKSKGNSFFETTKILTETTFSFELPKDKTPDGINQITLFDNNYKPQSERLVYVENEHDLDVQLVVDKSGYKPKEKTTINITSKSKAGQAKSASFSLSVTDMNGEVEDKDFGTNICSYYLMESDIRGKVHNPAYYFDPTNLKRLEYLDNLLLTQGWRDFLWKTTPKAEGNFKAEKGITISGIVKQMFGSKALENNKLTLTLKNEKQMNFFSAMTDSIGRFKFENLMFSGKTIMLLNNRNEKGKFGGEIVLDPMEYSPLPVFFKKSAFDWSERTRLIAKNVFKKYVALGVDPENMLKEVEILGKKKEVTIYGIPNYSYKADEKTEMFPSIYEVLEEVPSVWVNINRDIKILGEYGDPLLLVDGQHVTRAEFDFVYPNEVIKIEVARGDFSAYFMSEGEFKGGVISVFTTGSLKNRPRKESVHSFSKKIEGFQIARIFYAPNLEKPNEALDDKLDVINTIYWNPFVHPDKTGNTSVSYYNSIVETKVKVALEGITGTGIPVVKNVYYNIKK